MDTAIRQSRSSSARKPASFTLTDVRPMEARRVTELPRDAGWQFEPKWDGFRCLAWKRDGRVDLIGKSGKSLGRYFPEVVEALQTIAIPRFGLDGELVIPMGRQLSFDALQQRLHPAGSRIQKLSRETPALAGRTSHAVHRHPSRLNDAYRHLQRSRVASPSDHAPTWVELQ